MAQLKNHNLFTEQIIGTWIVQSTNYYTLQGGKFTDRFTSKVKYTPITNYEQYINHIEPNLSVTYDNNNIKLYYVEYQINQLIKNPYYILILNPKFQKTSIYKFDYKFNITSQFIVECYSENYLSIISKNNSINIIEKIFFLTNNLKAIKSIIKKDDKHVSISYSSEIRIS